MGFKTLSSGLFSLGFNVVSGLGPFHDAGQAGRAHQVVGLGLKTTVLTMSPFSPAEGLYFFNQGKYGALNLVCGKLRGMGELMCTLNAL